MQFTNKGNCNFSRHDLVWVSPEFHLFVTDQITDRFVQSHVASWLQKDLPLVVSRQPLFAEGVHPSIQPDTIAVGLSLPANLGKGRISLIVPAVAITKHSFPLRLTDTILHAPVNWQSKLASLDVAAKLFHLELRVFGSLSWQALSGLPYMSIESDIDMVWHAHTHQQLQKGISLLLEWERNSLMRADGEVIFAGRSAISWREWSRLKSIANQRVLVKQDRSAQLVSAHELLELLD